MPCFLPPVERAYNQEVKLFLEYRCSLVPPVGVKKSRVVRDFGNDYESVTLHGSTGFLSLGKPKTKAQGTNLMWLCSASEHDKKRKNLGDRWFGFGCLQKVLPQHPERTSRRRGRSFVETRPLPTPDIPENRKPGTNTFPHLPESTLLDRANQLCLWCARTARCFGSVQRPNSKTIRGRPSISEERTI